MNLYDIAIARKLSGGGGGGSSDFSTATMNFVSESFTKGCSISGAMTLDMDELNVHQSIGYMEENYGGDVNTIILYKGKAEIKITSTYTITASGSITDFGDGRYVVTGDCTITIS